MIKSSIAETWSVLPPSGRLLTGLISLFLIACTAFSCFSTVLVIFLPVPTPTPQAAPTFTLSPSPNLSPDFTSLPSPSLTPLPTRRGSASSTPPIYVVTPTNTSFRYLIPSVTLTITQIPPNKAVCVCYFDKYDCPSFPTQKRAQACYDFCASQGFGDVHHLDEDNGDGIACNSLLRPPTKEP